MPDDVEIAAAHAASEESHNEEGVAEVVALDPTVTSVEEGASSDPPSDVPDDAPRERVVAIIPTQFTLNPRPLADKSGTDWGQLGFGNVVFGGELWLDRGQLVELGSQFLQLAGLMRAPKDKPQNAPQQALPPKLVGAHGETLVP